MVGIIISIFLAATTGLSPISAQTTSEVMVDAGKNRALIATSGENISRCGGRGLIRQVPMR